MVASSVKTASWKCTAVKDGAGEDLAGRRVGRTRCDVLGRVLALLRLFPGIGRVRQAQRGA
jgi:hypothetical protein